MDAQSKGTWLVATGVFRGGLLVGTSTKRFEGACYDLAPVPLFWHPCAGQSRKQVLKTLAATTTAIWIEKTRQL